MKDGPDLRIIEPPLRPDVSNDLIEFAALVAGDNQEGSELAGYALVATYSNGSSAIGYHVPDMVPRQLFPSFFAECLRQRVPTQDEACRNINRANGWDEDEVDE